MTGQHGSITYTSGKFGFYNYSQGRARYQGFTREQIPEPSTLALVGMGALGVLACAWRRKKGA